jgi:hypothetical protein
MRVGLPQFGCLCAATMLPLPLRLSILSQGVDRRLGRGPVCARNPLWKPDRRRRALVHGRRRRSVGYPNGLPLRHCAACANGICNPGGAVDRALVGLQCMQPQTGTGRAHARVSVAHVGSFGSAALCEAAHVAGNRRRVHWRQRLLSEDGRKLAGVVASVLHLRCVCVASMFASMFAYMLHFVSSRVVA